MSSPARPADQDETQPIALIADLHANLPALQAVLEDIPANARIACLGDLTGYYTEPEEVCRQVMDRACACIRGNHDAYVLGALPYPAEREDLYRIAWTRSRLSAGVLDWLGGLPRVQRLRLRASNGSLKTIILRHANLEDEVSYLYPDSPLDDLVVEDDCILALGHTHHPMVRRADGGVVVNPGSVGQPRDYRPGACYGLLEPDGRFRLVRVSYDVSGYQARLSDQGVQSWAISVLSRVRKDARSSSVEIGLW
jgi:predicted phosphodiesterase